VKNIENLYVLLFVCAKKKKRANMPIAQANPRLNSCSSSKDIGA
jgi:hypothetical protein